MYKVCKYCGKKLTGKQKLYCSRKCKCHYNYNPKAYKFTCVICGTVGMSRSTKKLVCSKECQRKYRLPYYRNRNRADRPKARKKISVNSKCPTCGTIHEVTMREGENINSFKHLYCSSHDWQRETSFYHDLTV